MSFWISWVTFSLIGIGVSAIPLVLGYLDVGLAMLSVVAAPLFALMIFIPTGQAIALRKYLTTVRPWVLVTGVGYFLGFILIIFKDKGTHNFLLTGLIPGGLYGFPTGLLQWWFVLGKQVGRSWIWIFASLVCWAIGGAVVSMLYDALPFLNFVAGYGLAIALTGLVMDRLLKLR